MGGLVMIGAQPTANLAASFHIKGGIGVVRRHLMIIGWLPLWEMYSTSAKFTKPRVRPNSSLLWEHKDIFAGFISWLVARVVIG